MRSGLSRIRQIEERLQRLENALSAVFQPEPDFDLGWVQLEPQTSIVWSREAKRRVARLDVLRRVGEEEFSRVPSRLDSGGVWYRPWPPNTPFKDAEKFVIYNRTEDVVPVRVQGWYEARFDHQ